MSDNAKVIEITKAAIAALRDSAKSNKRISENARRAARRDMAAREELISKCRAAGIHIVIEPEE